MKLVFSSVATVFLFVAAASAQALPIKIKDIQKGDAETPTVTTDPAADSVPNLSGTWTGKFNDGKTPDATIVITQSEVTLSFQVNEKRFTGCIQGNQASINGVSYSGTIDPSGDRIRWSDGVWVRNVSSTSESDVPGGGLTATQTNTLVPVLTGTWVVIDSGGNTELSTVATIDPSAAGYTLGLKTPGSTKKTVGHLENGRIVTGW